MAELELAIYQWLATWNDEPQALVWKATPDAILDKVHPRGYCKDLARTGDYATSHTCGFERVGGFHVFPFGHILALYPIRCPRRPCRRFSLNSLSQRRHVPQPLLNPLQREFDTLDQGQMGFEPANCQVAFPSKLDTAFSTRDRSRVCGD